MIFETTLPKNILEIATILCPHSSLPTQYPEKHQSRILCPFHGGSYSFLQEINAIILPAQSQRLYR